MTTSRIEKTALYQWRAFSLITESPNSPGYIFPRDLLPIILESLFKMEYTKDYIDCEYFYTKIESMVVNGNLPLLQYVNKKHHITLLKQEKSNLFAFAASHGRLNIIKYLHEELGFTGDNDVMFYAVGDIIGDITIYEQLEMIIYFHETMGLNGDGIMVNDAITFGVSDDKLIIVKYMHEKMKIMGTDIAINTSVYYKCLNIVKYMHEEMGLTCDQYHFALAAIDGNLAIVKYIHEKMGLVGSNVVIETAIQFNQIEVANYLKSIMPAIPVIQN